MKRARSLEKLYGENEAKRETLKKVESKIASSIPQRPVCFECLIISITYLSEVKKFNTKVALRDRTIKLTCFLATDVTAVTYMNYILIF